MSQQAQVRRALTQWSDDPPQSISTHPTKGIQMHAVAFPAAATSGWHTARGSRNAQRDARYADSAFSPSQARDTWPP